MVQDCFPKAGLGLDDVRATWAGIRPLIQEPGKSTRDTSRHDQVWAHTPGVVTVAGGKLTTYRPMAHRTLAAVARQLGGDPPRPDRSADVPLPGGELAGQDPEAYREAHARTFMARGVAPATAARLTWLYGSQLDDLIALADHDPDWLEALASRRASGAGRSAAGGHGRNGYHPHRFHGPKGRASDLLARARSGRRPGGRRCDGGSARVERRTERTRGRRLLGLRRRARSAAARRGRRLRRHR